jgi:hypothetical protein
MFLENMTSTETIDKGPGVNYSIYRAKMNMVLHETSGRTIFADSALRSKLMAVFVIFCLLANAFLPKFALNQRDYDVLSEIMANQSLLLSYLSFSTIPMKIVSDLFTEKNAVATGKTGKQKSEDKANSASASSEFSLMNACSQNLRVAPQWTSGFGGSLPAVALHASRTVLSPSENLCAAAGFRIFLLLVLFFFMLPRSSVGDYYILKSFPIRVCTQLAVQSWVFYLPIITDRSLQ